MYFRAVTLHAAPECTLGHALAPVPNILELARGVLVSGVVYYVCKNVFIVFS